MTAVFGAMQSVALSGLKGVGIGSQDGGSAGLFYTTNGGKRWTVSNITDAIGRGNKYTNQFVCMDGDNALALSLTGPSAAIMYYSTNAGVTWSVSTGPTLTGGVAFPGVIGYGEPPSMAIKGSNGLFSWGNNFLYSSDIGATWQYCQLGGASLATSMNSISLLADGHAIAVKSSPGAQSMMHSTNFGQTWTASTGFPTDAYLAVCSMNTSGVAIYGVNNPAGTRLPMYYSTNYGVSVSAASGLPIVGFVPQSIVIDLGSNNCFGVNSNGSIYYSTNGSSWSAASGISAISGDPCAVKIVGNKAIAGSGDVWVYSTNGGATWARNSNSISGIIKGSADLTSDGNGVMSKTNKLYYTTNSGVNWLEANLPIVTSISPNTGSELGGTPVTISGSNFIGTLDVTFNDNLATDLIIVSDIQITCVTPPGNIGFANLIVRNASSSGSLYNFQYIAAPITITSISPTSGNKDGGTQVTITGYSFTGVNRVTFGGVDATSFSVVSSTEITCVAPPGFAGPEDVVVFTSDSSYTATNGFTNNIICFKEGSKILTDKGYIAVEELRNGDLVKTVSSGFKKIEHIGFSKMYNNANEIRSKDKLYRCPTSEYPELTEDLVITGCHAILVKKFKDQEQKTQTKEILGDNFVTDKHYRLPACLDDRTKIFEEEGVHTIWHFSLEHSDYYMNYGVYANGLLVETTSNRMMVELSGMTLV